MRAKSILLIEPEASIREVLHFCLRELGDWQVTSSSSIQEGIEVCRGERELDAILLDTSSSETDVLIFTEQLKQHSMMRSIPILLITARASWFTLSQFREMGFAGAIAKPFNSSTLSAQIHHLLESSSSAQT
jgi:CheY-like chemotaxis protein